MSQETDSPQRRIRLEPRLLRLPTRTPEQTSNRRRDSSAPEEWPDPWDTGPVAIPALGGNSSGLLPPAAIRTLPPAASSARSAGRVATPEREVEQRVDGNHAALQDPLASLEEVEAVEHITTLILPAIDLSDVSQMATLRLPAVVAGAETYVSLVRRLAQSSGIYALATLASPLVSLALAPFLTRYLSPSEYGTLALLNSMTALLAGITQLGLGSAFFRAYNYDYTEERDRRSVLGSILLLLGVASLIFAGVLAYFAPWIADAIFQQPSLARPLRVTAWVLLVQNLTVPGFSWLRAESKALFFSLLSITNVVVSLIANLTLVGTLGLGVEGSLLATGSGYAVVALCTLPPLILASRLHIRRQVVVSMLAFGLPLVLNFISFWVLQLSDRYLLALLGSLSETAKYAVAYSLGSIVSTVIMGPFTLAWPTAMFSIAKRKDAARVFRVVFRWFTSLLLFAAFGLSTAARMILVWFFPQSYQSAELIIPVISESLVFYGVYYMFMVGANVTRRTWLAAVFTTFAAVVNVGLNLLLIPYLHAFGAALSTLLAFIAMCVAAYVVNQLVYPIPYEVIRFIIAFLIGIAIYAGVFVLVGLSGEAWRWPINIAGLVFYTGILVIVGNGFRPLAIPIARRR